MREVDGRRLVHRVKARPGYPEGDMSEMPRQRPHRSKQDYRTPAPFLAAVRTRLGIVHFAIDLAATAANAVVPRFLDVSHDALAVSWAPLLEDGWGWLNPPYTDIAPWARRCRETREAGGSVAFLVPASVGANWFRDTVDGHALVLFLNGRLSFDAKGPYPKDCMLALYSPYLLPAYEVWTWSSSALAPTTQGVLAIFA
jgi:phage N-6-adenine-methyltransferase